MGSSAKCRKSPAKNARPLLTKSAALTLDKNEYSVKEASLILGVSMDTVSRHCKAGKLLGQPVTYGKKRTFVIPRQAILIYLQEQKQAEVLQQVRHLPQKSIPLPHAEYKKRFQKALETGTLNGKVYSPRTVDDYLHYLELYLARHDEISPEGLEEELAGIDPKRKATKVHYYKAILCFARFLVSKNVLEEDVIAAIKKLRPQENKNPVRHVVTLLELTRLEEACQTTSERFLLRLLVSTGLRVSEACSLNWSNINFERAEIVNIEGKGGKVRDVAIPPKAFAVFKEFYLKAEDKSADAPLLINRNGERMKPRGVHQRLESLGERAGVKVHPHALRRAYVTINANQGVPMKALQESCGHSDLATTSAYCRTSKDEALAIMKQVNW